MLDHASFDYPPNVAPTAIGDVCIGIRGNFKSVIPYDKSHIYFTASKEKGNKLKKEWDVDLSGALRVPETGLPIQVNNDLKIKVCSYLPPDFKNEKDTEIIITARITIPDNEGGKSNVLCVKGPLRLS
ncbi:hypothetical protein BGX23_002767 [Mortierella sp. AD031]|nr:hypothetical protein BGX23_002767 [Mortierella sp. AD031]